MIWQLSEESANWWWPVSPQEQTVRATGYLLQCIFPVSKYYLCTGLWPKSGLCTITLYTEADRGVISTVWTLQPTYNKPLFPLPKKTSAVSLKEKGRQLNSKNFVQGRPTQDVSASRVLAWWGALCARYLSVMGQTRANVAWCSPYSFMRLLPHSLHPPLSTPSVCGMRECGSKKRKDDILTVVADLHRAFVCSIA